MMAGRGLLTERALPPQYIDALRRGLTEMDGSKDAAFESAAVRVKLTWARPPVRRPTGRRRAVHARSLSTRADRFDLHAGLVVRASQ